MDISIKWNLCRVCLHEEQISSVEGASSSSHQMKDLFSDENKLAMHIYELFQVSMKKDDSLPSKICQKCVSVINNAVQFRNTCRSSDVYLKSILERVKSANTLSKPEILQCQVSDDDVELDEMDCQPSIVLKKEFDYIKLNNNVTAHHKFKEQQPLSEEIEKDSSLDHQENEVEQELPEYIVELEEIVDASEDLEGELFPQTIEDGTDEEFISPDNIEDSNTKNVKTSQLQKFYMSASFSKMRNIEESSSNSFDDQDFVETENFDKKVKDENAILNGNTESFDGFDDSVSSEHVEFDIIDDDDAKIDDDVDESLIVHLEDNTNDENQAQVSSTVDTNDEIEYYEHNSSISNTTSDLDEERLTDENFSNCSITEGTSRMNLQARKIAKKSAYTHADKRTSCVMKLNRNLFKSSAYTTSKKYVCDICGNQFANRNLMNIHMKVHYQFRNHRCELCFKSFITACNLQAHMRIHTGERPFECKYCGRRFNDSTSNKRHERTHTNEKPFTCPSCGKSFSLSTTLQNHMKVHTNERSYRCEPCGKSFKLAHHLKTHQTTSLHKYALEAGANEP